MVVRGGKQWSPASPRKRVLRLGNGGAHLASVYLAVLALMACCSVLRLRVLLQPSAPSTPATPVMTPRDSAFWAQPDGAGLEGCVEFSPEFQRESAAVVAQRQRYLVVVVNGGLNQQRAQIVDAVVIARVLGAALVAPVMEVNQIWLDESEFSDVFDLDHFKATLRDEVRVVSSLPSTLVAARSSEEKHTPLHATPRWLRQHYGAKMRRDGVLILRGLDSRVAKDLPLDLQKLRCKTAFHALRFARPVHELGSRLAARMRRRGPYLALHLRLELDVWVRTGCLPGLGPAFDSRVRSERKAHPSLLTARGAKMAFSHRKSAGLCPLTGGEVARLLKGLGAGNETRIYWAGGEPLGKELALAPLRSQFSELHNKETLASAEELAPFRAKPSILAAVDYLVCLHSNVFMASHGGNFNRLMQGHRAYLGHRKHVVPNKREVVPLLLNGSMAAEEFGQRVRELHEERVGRPVVRAVNTSMDVLAFPVPECMCRRSLRGEG